MGNIEIQGKCADSFKSVKEAFLKNFKEDLEVGASCAVTLNGEYMVDIWGGYANAEKTRAWEENTLVNVYSTTKIMTAMCVLICVDRGLIDLESPVSKYWSEFAQEGKENVLVKHLLSHTAGLPGFDTEVTAEDLYNWDKIINLLASQRTWWEPGKKIGYHSITFGYLLGEIVRRVTGKSLGTFFRDEIALPLNADFHIGLPAQYDDRVADLVPPASVEAFNKIDPNSLIAKVLLNPKLTGLEPKTRDWRAAEIPASNGHGNARSVTRIGSLLACNGSLDKIKILSSEIIEKAIQRQKGGIDGVLLSYVLFGLGFGLNSKRLKVPKGPNPRTFYWGGAGGSTCIMDPDNKLCFSYAMNKMYLGLTGDIRTERLIKAVFDSIE